MSSFWKPVGDINLLTLMYVEMLLGKAWACVGALGIPRKHLFCLGSGWVLDGTGDEKRKDCMAPGLVKGYCLT